MEGEVDGDKGPIDPREDGGRGGERGPVTGGAEVARGGRHETASARE